MTHPFLDRIKKRLVADVVAQGGDPAETEVAVGEMLSAHPILDLLKSLDWASIVALIVKLIAKP